MDKNLRLNVLVECLDQGGKSPLVKIVVALYLLVFIAIVRLECLIALMMVLLGFFYFQVQLDGDSLCSSI